MTVGTWLNTAAETITAARGEDYHSDARWMLCDALGISASALFFEKDRVLTEAELALLNGMLARRAAGEPMQYITGTEGFMGLPFQVDRSVLIPRADTETLCEFALNELKPLRRPAVLDMCTGSGALAVAIRKMRPDARVTACDISEEALATAEKNALRNGTDIEFLQGDLFAPVRGRKFDLIVCNPPYLTAEDMEEISDEVKAEPALALYGGPDGLDFYRRIAKDAPLLLTDRGVIALEIGMGQANDVQALFQGYETGTVRDLSGIERVVYVRRK